MSVYPAIQHMHLIRNQWIILLALSFSSLLGALQATETSELQAFRLTALEDRLIQIDTELEQLAHFTLRGGVGNVGWLSSRHNNAPSTEWVQIELEANSVIDQIMLTPVIWRDTQNGYQSDGFPSEFKVIMGDETSQTGRIVAEFTAHDQVLPRIAPLTIPLPPTSASWVRIEAKTELSNAWDGEYKVQFSEIMIFSGDKNIALNQPVSVSSELRNRVAKSMHKSALVDGLTPYLMDAAQGDKSAPYIAFYNPDVDFSFIIDLGQNIPLSGVNLHAADIRESIPRIHHSDYGIPKELRIEGAQQSDFSDATMLTSYRHDSVYEAGPILMLNFTETNCRYLRITSTNGYGAPEAMGTWRCFGLAEIELLMRGKNQALGKPTLATFDNEMTQGELVSLTDGRNHFGQILPTRQWLNQLAQRHSLEVERPLVVTELSIRYANQKKNLRTMYWVAGSLAIAIILIVLINRIIRMRHIAQLKERFAADLHDELGANLHSIGLISDVAQDAQSPEEWQTLSRRIRELTERTGIAVRHCTNMLESDKLYIGLVDDMQRAAERITTNLEHEVVIKGEAFLNQLKPRDRVDLFLFYKECLVNICRHSGATKMSTQLEATKHTVLLSVTDNGTGLPKLEDGQQLPTSLQRRAQLLKANMTVDAPDEGGTCVRLELSLRKW